MLYSRLETPRLYLREWHESDLEDLFSYAADPDVGPAAGWPPHTDRSVSREILWQFMDKGEVWAIVDKKTHKSSARWVCTPTAEGITPTAAVSGMCCPKLSGGRV